MIIITNIALPLDYTEETLRAAAAKKLAISPVDVLDIKITRKSIDARDKSAVRYVVNAHASLKNEGGFEAAPTYTPPRFLPFEGDCRPVIVGSGPAGMFAALTLAMRGAKPIVLERGGEISQRKNSVNTFWSQGKLNINSNVQFGEGGAGTFSDGKLTTRTSDINHRFILEEFVKAGADSDILINSKPHIGTDRLGKIVEYIRKKVISMGGEYHFDCQAEDFIIKNNKITAVVTPKGVFETRAVILATGHSARDTFTRLYERGVKMEQKPFAVGARIEHLQENINKAQYGAFAPYLGAADYKAAVKTSSGRAVYTFCMCPGGSVVAAASCEGGVVTNGMSDFARAGSNANSALLTPVTSADIGSDDVFAAMEFQRKIERAAFSAAGKSYAAPVQRVGDFVKSTKCPPMGIVNPTYLPNTVFCDLNEVFPKFISEALGDGIVRIGRMIKGFDAPDAILCAPETRSSSPVRILRGENLASSVDGLYPCGEGAGYAGGIMSAAADGIRIGSAIS